MALQLAKNDRTNHQSYESGHSDVARVLIVDDDRPNLELFTKYLENAGYAVDQAADGEQAFRTLQHDPDYALVVTDRNMPVMNGLELAQRMKQHPQLKHIPIIIQTGANTPQDVAEGIRADVYYYLTKPFEEESLVALVRSAIRERAQRRAFSDRIVKQNHALGTFCYGKFELKTPEEAENVAFLLGSLFPDPERAIIGLYELTLNAIEHGNLALGYDEKNRHLTLGSWEDEIARRLASPEHRNKKVVIVFSQSDTKIDVTITDQGQGFDWKSYMDMEPSRATQSNGRGIAKTNLLCFDGMQYHHNGNVVHVMTKLHSKDETVNYSANS